MKELDEFRDKLADWIRKDASDDTRDWELTPEDLRRYWRRRSQHMFEFLADAGVHIPTSQGLMSLKDLMKDE